MALAVSPFGIRRRFWRAALALAALALWLAALGHALWSAAVWNESGRWPHRTLEVLLQWEPETQLEFSGAVLVRLFTLPLDRLLPLAAGGASALAALVGLAPPAAARVHQSLRLRRAGRLNPAPQSAAAEPTERLREAHKQLSREAQTAQCEAQTALPGRPA